MSAGANISHARERALAVTRCLLKKGVVNADERVLETVNLMDFLAFTQRFAIKQSESECESADSDSQYRSFGFCERGNEKNRKKSSRSKKDKKKCGRNFAKS